MDNVNINKMDIQLIDLFNSEDQKTEVFKTILEAISSLILIADKNATVCYVNNSFLSVYGISREEIIGKKLKSPLLLPEVIKEGKYLPTTYLNNAKEGWVADLKQLVVYGDVIGGITFGRDVSNISKLSSEIRKHEVANKRLTKMITNAYRAKYTFDDIVGDSDIINKKINLAKKVAKSEANILVTGESGTGKELFVQAIHNASNRFHKRFVAINCAAIAPSLVESELFGYEDGAFTGAKKGGEVGLFQVANGGTIFLDEIGDLSLDIQAKLLRVLQEGCVRMVGALCENEIDVRVIAATNKDLKSRVKDGLFREDLYYRLNVIEINLPPLNQRSGDIELIIKKILADHSMKYNRKYEFEDEAMEIMLKYNWPGNIRELKNAIEYSITMCGDDNYIKLVHLPNWLQPKDDFIKKGTLAELTREFEKQTIETYISRYGDDIDSKKRIAKELGISVATLYNKIRTS